MKSTLFWLSALSMGSAVATDVIYLVNGGRHDANSAMDYYGNIDNSHNGQYPDDVSYVQNSGFIQWEGRAITGYFKSGVSFTVHINGDASNYAVGQYAGYGSNNYHNYACFKDNNQQLWSNGDTVYAKVYYCKQSS